jgi:Bifunctional DNA primase/polymerase, N-terminal/AAA domain/Primase C terminal 1 (PriCT-1)
MSTQPDFKELAVAMAARNIPCIRLQFKSKKPMDSAWQNLATTDTNTICEWDKDTPKAGCACVAKPDGFLFFECDEKSALDRFEKETGESLKTFTVQSSPGKFHFYYTQTDLSRKVGSITQKQLVFGSLRQNDAYVVAPGSLHEKTGLPYKIVDSSAIVPIPDSLVNWLNAQRTSSVAATLEKTSAPAPTEPSGLVVTIDPELSIAENRDCTLASIAGSLRRHNCSRDEIHDTLTELNDSHVVQRSDDRITLKDVDRITKSVCRPEYAPSQEALVPTVLIGGRAIVPNEGTTLVGLHITKDAKVEEIRKAISKPTETQVALEAKTSVPIKPFVVNSGDEFLKRDIPQRRTFLELATTGEPVLFEQSINQTFAWRGSGKTCFSLGLVRALATAGQMLCFEAPERVRVLYVEGELPNAQIQERWRNIVGNTDGHAFLCTLDDQANGFTLASTEGQLKIEATLAELKAKGTPIEVLFLDSISTLFNVSANEEETWAMIQSWFISLRSRGITVCFTHHAGKTGLSRSHSKSEDMLDVSIKLSTPENNDPSLLHCTLEIDKARNGLSLRPFDFKMHREHSDNCICKTMTAPRFCSGDGVVWEMLTPADTKRAEAEHMFSIGTPLVDVSEQLELPEGTVRRWRTEWGKKFPEKSKVISIKSKSSKPQKDLELSGDAAITT